MQKFHRLRSPRRHIVSSRISLLTEAPGPRRSRRGRRRPLAPQPRRFLRPSRSAIALIDLLQVVATVQPSKEHLFLFYFTLTL